jgi:Holliday junction resolvasome RuvABC endonuclease subunit
VKKYTRLYECSLIVYDSGFIGRKASPQASMAIHGARTAVMIAAAEEGIEVRSFHPSTAKLVTGHGGASKDRVMRVMTAILQPDHELGEDEADACAIALTGEAETKKERLVAAAERARYKPGVVMPPRARKRLAARR